MKKRRIWKDFFKEYADCGRVSLTENEYHKFYHYCHDHAIFSGNDNIVSFMVDCGAKDTYKVTFIENTMEAVIKSLPVCMH